VAIGFVALLVIGLALGLVVYEKYVAYQPSVARHAPADATLTARLDITHVMLYEPSRRSFMPLVERGAPPGVKRADELAEHGVRLGADVRELLLALGPAEADWVLLVGGKLPKRDLADVLAGILEREGRTSVARAGGVRVLEDGKALGQANDGTFVFASSEARLRSALAPHASDEWLSRGAGGVVVAGAFLGEPWKALRASCRAGAHLSVEASASFSEPAVGAGAVRSLLEKAAKLDGSLAAAVQGAEIRPSGQEISFRIDLPKNAVEQLARWLAEQSQSGGWSAAQP
jgi:hypothetical protein